MSLVVLSILILEQCRPAASFQLLAVNGHAVRFRKPQMSHALSGGSDKEIATLSDSFRSLDQASPESIRIVSA